MPRRSQPRAPRRCRGGKLLAIPSPAPGSWHGAGRAALIALMAVIRRNGLFAHTRSGRCGRHGPGSGRQERPRPEARCPHGRPRSGSQIPVPSGQLHRGASGHQGAAWRRDSCRPHPVDHSPPSAGAPAFPFLRDPVGPAPSQTVRPCCGPSPGPSPARGPHPHPPPPSPHPRASTLWQAPGSLGGGAGRAGSRQQRRPRTCRRTRGPRRGGKRREI